MIVQSKQDSPRSGEEMEAALVEVRQLIADLRDAAQDGRDLARRYSAVLQTVVDEYCNEFELRASSALAKLEAAR
jgi:signal transduction histidine kinase